MPLPSLVWWTGTPLYRRMCISPRIERELSFSYAVDARTLFVTEANERILLQGVIDCCFMEEDGWTLIDYKTDRVPDGVAPLTVAKRHAAQLDLYAAALSALTGVPVIRRYIVLLTAFETVRL